MFASTRCAAVTSEVASLLRAHVVRLVNPRHFFAAAGASLLELPRLDKPTEREFLAFRRENPGVPFLLGGGALDELGWKLSNWSPKDIRDRFGDVEVPLEVWRIPS